MKPALICASRCVAAALLLIGLSTQVSAAPVGMDLSLVAGHATTDKVHKLGTITRLEHTGEGTELVAHVHPELADEFVEYRQG